MISEALKSDWRRASQINKEVSQISHGKGSPKCLNFGCLLGPTVSLGEMRLNASDLRAECRHRVCEPQGSVGRQAFL